MFLVMITVQQEVCFYYWAGVLQFGRYTIEQLGEEKHKGFVERSLRITHTKVLVNSYIITVLMIQHQYVCCRNSDI